MIEPQWQLGEGYDLINAFPAGAAGAVWLVRTHADGSERAIKILRPELTYVAEVVDEFRALLDSVRGLGHPGILVAGETVVHGDRVALVSPRMPGEDLRTLLDRQLMLTPAASVLMIADVCDALAAAHAVGIVHGDIKPSNLLLGPDPEAGTPRAVRLNDFGMAALAARSGMAMLPAEYQAPETDAGQQLLTPASDVYALGIVLYEALAGHTPFTGAFPDDVARLHREVRPPRIPVLPDQLWVLISACLGKHPLQRPAAAELAELLREIAPSIVALPSLAGHDTIRIAQAPIAEFPQTEVPAPAESPLAAVPTPAQVMPAGHHAVPSRSLLSAVRGIGRRVELAGDHSGPPRSALGAVRGAALAVFSGAVVVVAGVTLLHASSGSTPVTFTIGSTTEPALNLGSPSIGFTSIVSATPRPTATKRPPSPVKPKPSPTHRTASPTPSPSAASSSPSSSVPTTPATTPSTATTTAAPTTDPVTVAWQCATNRARSGITKKACIGLGSDGALYVRGIFTAQNGQIINDIEVAVAGNGQFFDTTSESCGASSCSITGGPYYPSAGYYEAFAGVDRWSHNESSPGLYYPGD